MDTPGLSAPVLALLRQAEDTPNATILVSDQVEWTSKQLAEESGRVAAGLAARGGQARRPGGTAYAQHG